MTDGLLRRLRACSDSGTARRFAVCVEKSVPVASGAMARSGLGKGLGALIGTPSVATPRDGSDAGERVHQIELTSIVPSTLQPRKDFARDVLLELIESIRQHGIIQPLIVRQVGTRFELIAGERRWRAAQELGLATVPAIVRTANDLEVLELSLIENLQRADLNPIEEAQGYARLANEFGMRQEDIALKVGRSRAAVANALAAFGFASASADLVSSEFGFSGTRESVAGVKGAGRTIARCGNSFAPQCHGAFYGADGCPLAWHWSRTTQTRGAPLAIRALRQQQ